MENNNKNETVKIPKYKKIWFSMTKFEKYPDMAAEGVGRAFGYLAWFIFIFSLIIAIGLVIKLNIVAREGISYIDQNFENISYENGILSITPDKQEINSNIGNLIIDTKELNKEQEEK